MQRARANDCESEFFTLLLDLANVYLYADPWWWRGLDDTYSVVYMAVSTTNQLVMLWRVIDQCSEQYAFSVATPWL